MALLPPRVWQLLNRSWNDVTDWAKLVIRRYADIESKLHQAVTLGKSLRPFKIEGMVLEKIGAPKKIIEYD